ncbi:BC1881 family protein [Sporosarcina psychrophila]|uniref:General stress protein 17M-like domain-containing protein n=1 Tax=Sporosarcina psychrophila TaxID=1476 RepID=A0ABV2KBQ6_SPOPS
MADKQSKSRELSVKIDVDVSEALTGLKAVERQAKTATQALRVLETQGNVINVMTADSRELIASIGEGNAIVHNDFLVEYGKQAMRSDISSFSTKALSEELAKREGVTEYYVAPHGAHAELWIRDADAGVKHDLGGGAIILVNRD